jgi:hypothetical protein
MKKLGLALGLAAATAVALWPTASPTRPPRGVVENMAPALQPVLLGVYMTNGSGRTVISQRSRPELWISCDEDSCSARGAHASMHHARSMLARIANRSVRTELSLFKGTELDRTGLVVIYRAAAPLLSISCEEDTCSARSWHASLDDAKSMLERIAKSLGTDRAQRGSNPTIDAPAVDFLRRGLLQRAWLGRKHERRQVNAGAHCRSFCSD